MKDRLSCLLKVLTSALGVRRVKVAFFSGCKSHPAIAPAGSDRSSHGGNEVAEAFGCAVWKRVLRAVEELLSKERLAGVTVQ